MHPHLAWCGKYLIGLESLCLIEKQITCQVKISPNIWLSDDPNLR